MDPCCTWGPRFFESYHDYRVVDELNQDLNLNYINPNKQWCLLHPEQPDIIRAYLEGGAMDSVFSFHLHLIDKAEKNFAPEVGDAGRYRLFCFGMLCMRLGCHMGPCFPCWLKKECGNLGLNCMTEAKKAQVKKALDEYQNGTPYDIGGVCPKRAEDKWIKNHTKKVLKKGYTKSDTLARQNMAFATETYNGMLEVEALTKGYHRFDMANLHASDNDDMDTDEEPKNCGYIHQCPHEMEPPNWCDHAWQAFREMTMNVITGLGYQPGTGPHHPHSAAA